MISSVQISEILSLYTKHGWNLRRVLLSAALGSELGGEVTARTLFGGAEIVAADIDAAWFSRVSTPGRETWELRHLSSVPYALVEVFSDQDDDAARLEICSQAVEKLKNSRK